MKDLILGMVVVEVSRRLSVYVEATMVLHSVPCQNITLNINQTTDKESLKSVGIDIGSAFFE